MKEKKQLPANIRLVIVILLTLVILSTGALACRLIYLNFFADNTATAIVPDNVIGEGAQPNKVPAVRVIRTGARPLADDTSSPAEEVEDAASISLYKGQDTDNAPFRTENMLPGDREVRYFAVQVNHHADVTVYFRAQVTEQTQHLAEILQLRVTHVESGKVLYEGSFAQMNARGYGELFSADSSTETVAYYKIEVSLPTSAGNEYQGARLMADFQWFVQDTEPLDPPATGDSSRILLYSLMMFGALAGILILLFSRRRDKEEDHAEDQ